MTYARDLIVTDDLIYLINKVKVVFLLSVFIDRHF